MATHFPQVNLLETDRARERLMLDLRTLARDAEHLLEAKVEGASDNVREARKRLQFVVGRIKATCSELQHRGVASARTIATQGDDLVRSHPCQSIGVAFGLGVLVGSRLGVLVGSLLRRK